MSSNLPIPPEGIPHTGSMVRSPSGPGIVNERYFMIYNLKLKIQRSKIKVKSLKVFIF